VYVERGGDGRDPVLVLLHGLGGTAGVWHGVLGALPESWSWVAVDLPGHGRAEPLPRYSFGAMAAAVASTLDPERRHVLLGHSLGGVIALAIASGWYRVPVSAVCGLGVKVRWTPEELAKAAELGARPNRVFPSYDEAMARALRVAGLSAEDASLVREVDGGWQLALDPAAFAVGAPDMPGLLAAARAQVTLAAGEHDHMSPVII
jgi:pimeloyl-ACP methyl ester carboxylesterase